MVPGPVVLVTLAMIQQGDGGECPSGPPTVALSPPFRELTAKYDDTRSPPCGRNRYGATLTRFVVRIELVFHVLIIVLL